MPDMNGTIPTDLPEKPLGRSQWSLADRIAAAKSISGYTDEERQSAVAITINEQPGRIPVNNCCGLMCQGPNRPWGWADVWEDRPPNGYALTTEGQTGKTGVFFAFETATDSLLFLLKKVRSRGITTADVYAEKWVGGGAQTAGAIAGFNASLSRVRANWGTGAPVELPDEVPKSWPTLAYGDTGEDVTRLQRLLTQCGFPVEVDGEFGGATRSAVIAFQRENRDQHGNALDMDGKVGKNTWWSLTHRSG